MSRLTRDGTADPVSRDQILRRERGQRSFHFPCSAGHVQDWEPSYPVDPYSSYICVTIYSYIHIICVCAVFPFILDVWLVDVPSGGTQEEDHTGFLHLLLRCLP